MYIDFVRGERNLEITTRSWSCYSCCKLELQWNCSSFCFRGNFFLLNTVHVFRVKKVTNYQICFLQKNQTSWNLGETICPHLRWKGPTLEKEGDVYIILCTFLNPFCFPGQKWKLLRHHTLSQTDLIFSLKTPLDLLQKYFKYNSTVNCFSFLSCNLYMLLFILTYLKINCPKLCKTKR